MRIARSSLVSVFDRELEVDGISAMEVEVPPSSHLRFFVFFEGKGVGLMLREASSGGGG